MTVRALLISACALAFAALTSNAFALTPEQTLAIASGDNDSRIAALNAAVARGDARLAAFVQALLDDEVKVAGDKVFVVHDGQATDAASGAAATLPDGAEDVTNNNRTRGALEAALAGLRVLSPELAARRAAVDELAKASLDESQLPLIEKAFAAETDAGLKGRLERMRATILVSSSDRAKRLAAARELAGSNQSAVASLLQERARTPAARATRKCAPRCSRRSLRCARGSPGGSVWPSSSPGSASARVLLLVALGLAITYGLMGVINMAHGELMMIGAYTTYVVQNLFRAYWPGAFDAYLLAAIPVAFAVVGAGRRRARARRDPLPLRPAARDAARDLGHQPRPACRRCARSSARRTCRSRTPAGCRAASRS